MNEFLAILAFLCIIYGGYNFNGFFSLRRLMRKHTRYSIEDDVELETYRAKTIVSFVVALTALIVLFTAGV